jgi:signal transduction histidine kinase
MLVGAVLVAAVSGVVWLLERHAPVQGLGVLYLLAVLPVAVVWGVLPAVVLSVASVAVFGFFFVPPSGSFDLSDSTEWVALAAFLIVSVVVSELAARQRRGNDELVQRATEQAALSRVATLVAQGAPPEHVFEAVTREVGLLCDAELARMEHFEPDGTVSAVAAWGRSEGHLAVGTRFPLEGASIAVQVRTTGRPARVDSFVGAHGPIAEEARALGIRSSVGCPIFVGGHLWGVIAASTTSELPFPTGTELQIGEFTELVSTAIANAQTAAQLRASRARLVAASDDARRRIERDLHDGAQQRLVSLALDLRIVEGAVSPQLVELKGDLSRVADGLDGLLDELREIARGIHPAILGEGGIEPALKTLARRSPIPVAVDVRTRARLSEPVEVAAYYVVAETITNAAKHAESSIVRVEVEQRDGFLKIFVQDDGVGGADPARGSGLTGLKDRVEALGGALVVESPVGAGTSVNARIPLAR